MYIERRTGRASFQDRLTDLLPAAIILGLKDVTVFAPVHWTDDARVAAQRMMETCQEMELDSRLVWEGGSCRLVVVVPSGGRNW